MKRRTILSLTLVAIFAVGAINAFGQNCPTTITLGNDNIQPCSTQRVDIPVYIANACSVGGFQMQVYTTDPNWLQFDTTFCISADTIGSRISDWEAFAFTVNRNPSSMISIIGIADMPGGDTVSLPPGEGLLCTLHLPFTDHLVCDSVQLLNFGTTGVSDPSGYYLLQPLYLARDSVHVEPGRCHGNPRGDANCNGILNGIDVTYLVTFFHGGPSFCCLCSGDANNSGSVNGIDVTFLIAYFKGGGAPPAPCE